jgi:hypothetical protein
VVAHGACHAPRVALFTHLQAAIDMEKEVIIDKGLNGHGTFHGLM